MELYKNPETPINNINDFFKKKQYPTLQDNIVNCLNKYFFEPKNFRYYIESILQEHYDDDPKVNNLTLKVRTLSNYFLQVMKFWGTPIESYLNDHFLFNGKFWQQFKLSDALMVQILSGVGVQSTRQNHRLMEELMIEIKRHLNEIIEDNVSTNYNMINLANGMLFFESNGNVKLTPHNKDIFITYCLNYKYEPKAKAPKFVKYLDSSLPNKDYQNILQEFLGWIFLNRKEKRFKFEKCLFLVGGGGNGKGVLYEILEALIGEENVGAFSISGITNDTNQAYAVCNKLVNYGSEIQKGDKINFAIFKQMISNEKVNVWKKYSDQQTMRFIPRLIFSMNALPTHVEFEYAYRRRLIIIPFEQTFTEDTRDSTLTDSIIQNELSGVLNWVIEGAKRLVINGKFSETPDTQRLVTEYLAQHDNIRFFIAENGIIGSNRNVVKGDLLYRKYDQFCRESNIKPYAKQTFYKNFESHGFVVRAENPKRYTIDIQSGFNQKFLQGII